MKYVVLGLGISGRSTIRFLLSKGKDIVAVDDRLIFDEELRSFQQKGVQFASSDFSLVMNDAACLVKSPGVPESHALVQIAKAVEIPVIGDVELGTAFINKMKCVGVTGTNGKTTVSLLIEHILQSAGKQFKVCGNVGVPITDTLMEGECEGLVIELSSYQLETLTTPFLDVAVLLNITPDHLDRYPSFKEYRDAKLSIFSLLKENGVGIVNTSVNGINKEKLISYGFHSTLPRDVVERYQGHELDNIEAAFYVGREFGLSDNLMADALFTFKKPPHRIELVCRARGVSYYNDSKGTNIDAVEKAVNAMDGDVLLIAGGVDKGSSYVSWKHSFSGKVKKICAIGEAAPKIQQQLGKDFLIDRFDSLEQAVAHATDISKPGDNILLSPGCASFDMFRDYQHRGDEFKRIVQLITIGE